MWSKHLGGMAPGTPPDIFPPGAAKKIEAGSYFMLQMHYTPSGEETTDQSKIGLYFADGPPELVVRTRVAWNRRFRIPPGAANHKVDAHYTFRRPGTIYGLSPHMHVRGKSFRYDLVKPDGKRETILNVPEYDFDWQHGYELETPIVAPRGTRIEAFAVFDNSENNPANPDPTASVRWGDQTWEEMMIGFMTVTFENESGQKTSSAKKSKASSS